MTRELTPPRDPYNLVFCLMYYMAIGTLLPWNFFINVNGYWMWKFRTLNSTVGLEEPNLTFWNKNELQLEFTSDLALAAMIPNVAFLILNGVFGHRFRTTPRLLGSLSIVILLFISALIFVRVDTDTWQHGFLVLTLVTVVFINVFNALFQGGLFGLAGSFPTDYMNAVLKGQGIGGVFAAGINIALLALGGNDVDSAFYCFILANVFLGGSLVSVAIMSRTDIYIHFTRSRDPASSHPETSPLLDSPSQPPPDPEISSVLSSIRLEALTVYVIYVVTLGCFPALTVLVESTEGRSKRAGPWEAIYFVPVCCFLLYNIGDYIGRALCAIPYIPELPSSLALIFALLRVVFFPLFLFCNLAPMERHYTPVLFQSDPVYCAIMLCFAITNGYLTSAVMVAAPLKVESHEKQTASNLMGGILGCGLITGALLSAGMVRLL